MEVILHKSEKAIEFGVLRLSLCPLLILLYLDIEKESEQV